MRINGYRCDGCSIEHLLDSTRVLQYPSEGLPSTWLVVGYGRLEAEAHTFCSKKCLSIWMANDAEVKESYQSGEWAGYIERYLNGDNT